MRDRKVLTLNERQVLAEARAGVASRGGQMVLRIGSTRGKCQVPGS